MPAVVELAQGPLLVLALGAVGVLLGRMAPVAPLALLLVVVIVFVEVPLAAWAPDTAVALGRAARQRHHRRARRLGPVRARQSRDCGIVERFDIVAMAWHLVALAVVTAAAAAAALAVTRRD